MKIGILTHYYGSKNYGGLLQAYALTKVIDNLDNCEARQICLVFENIKYIETKNSFKNKLSLIYVIRWIKYKISRRINKVRIKEAAERIEERNTIFAAFENFIPHTDEIYTSKNIVDCISNFDVFVTGSDQVWNYDWYNPIYFINFVKGKKISYAASVGHSRLPVEWMDIYHNHLKDFSAISVRETEAIDLLQDISPVEVEQVLDPTLLLTSSDWNEICSDQLYFERYLFCYFLGNSKQQRNIAKKFAKRKGLKIVTLPHVTGTYIEEDKNFGDVQLWNVGPKEFISLVKYADFVLTDSYHATVFSYIYGSPFATFERKGFKDMTGRVESFVSLTNTQNRFLSISKMLSVNYICSLSNEIPKETEKFINMKYKSIDFLKRNILMSTKYE